MRMMEFNLKKNSANIGVKLGVVLLILSTFSYIYDIKLFYNRVLSSCSFPIIIGFCIYSIYDAKKLQNQIISFKEAFTAYFVCIVVGYLILSVVDIIIFKFIDPEAGKIINEELMIQQKEIWDSQQKPEDEITKGLANMQNYPRYSYFSVYMNYMFTILFNAFVGLFPAFILKKS
tara:strand:- start:6 stop:530 length:525 start_codon:yes stop_codon:yes gene_type:complete